ncbi:hypothetical protein HY945_05405 [Candidatus Gottesmanbacteria bacterium]|nr:hypothetical protein [Candidatus Gottesmanbacteria bacterium]
MAGRPTKMTKATLGKLREAFLFGSTDEEACLFAQINPDTLYEYQKQHPEFSEQKGMWKKNPSLRARKVIFDNLSDPKIAMWYLERKVKKEFGSKDPTKPEEPGRQITSFVYEVPCKHKDCIKNAETLDDYPIFNRNKQNSSSQEPT